MLQVVRPLFRGHSFIMWSSELIQGIKYGADNYFIQIFHFFFAHLSLPPFLVSCLVAQSACLRILRNACSSDSSRDWPLYLSSLGLGPRVRPGSNVLLALFSSSVWAHNSYSILGSSSPTVLYLPQLKNLLPKFSYVNDLLNGAPVEKQKHSICWFILLLLEYGIFIPTKQTIMHHYTFTTKPIF